MIYKQFKDAKISLLGFGCMRFPVDKESGKVDVELTEKMVDAAIKGGVNYFDTAAPYHDGASETIIGSILKKYPRESFYLATKYPGHQIKPGLENESMLPENMFENQLKKCGVEYFDFYLLHNVCENSYPVYIDKNRHIIDYFVEQKKLGRIKHLGFSSHGSIENLKDFVNRYGDVLEFCQIQLNYLDWELQNAKAKYEFLSEKGLGIWVMEPVRGGVLADLNEGYVQKMQSLRPDESVAAWAFRWLQGLDNINVTLSGMSSMEQVLDNIKTYGEKKLLNAEENAVVENIRTQFANFVPCTGCGYCLGQCPQSINIPGIISAYNDLLIRSSYTPLMYIEALEEGKRPHDCLACRACEKQCPQKIEISEIMKKCDEKFKENPTWTKVCEERFKIANAKK